DKVPATFIASKKTKEHAPIGFGVMSLNEVIERIWILTNTKPGQDF
ncbi:conjugal transfer protein TraF, partial [Acinetobacter baumannii]